MKILLKFGFEIWTNRKMKLEKRKAKNEGRKMERDRGKEDPSASGCTRAQPEGRDDTQLSFFDGSRERTSQPLSGWSCRTKKDAGRMPSLKRSSEMR
jgi:hypothetical protein